MASSKEFIDQITGVLKGLTMLQKILAGVVVFGAIIGMISLTFKDSSAENSVLFSGLNQEDSADVVAKLKELRIPYTLSQEGGAILVPSEKVLETRLSLAAEGLPRGGGVGFEIFDKTSFGTTDFVQKLNYQRALQGELARTIANFQQVKEARIHIATPKESVFIEQEQPTTASVSVEMRGKDKLTKSQIQAIVHLVSSAVVGLESQNITVVDTKGRLLYRGEDNEEAILSDTQLEYQQKVEGSMRKKIESLFSEVVGEGRSLAQVTTDVDFSRVDLTQEEYDPEGQVIRSEQMLNEDNQRKEPYPQGIPGVKGNLATYGDEGSGDLGESYKRNNTTKNYEISKTTKHVREAVGGIKRVSVAVMVDGTYEKEVDKDGNTSLKYVSRSSEEMAYFEKLAKNAIGFNEERGDKVEVINMSFALSRIEEEKLSAVDKWREILDKVSMPLVYLLILLGVLLLVVRPFIKLLTERQLEEQRALLGAEQEDVEASRHKEEEDLKLRPMEMTDREKIYRLAQSDPDRAADLVRRWLREDE